MGNCACNHDAKRGIEAPAVDVHVSCMCPPDAFHHSALPVSLLTSKEAGKFGAYAVAGCEQPASKASGKIQTSNLKEAKYVRVEDTDVPPSSGKNRFPALDYGQQFLTDEGADAWHIPTVIDNCDKGHKGALARSKSAFQQQKRPDRQPDAIAEDTDSAVEAVESRDLSFEELNYDSGSDNETEQEPAPIQRPRKGAICCEGVEKGTFSPPAHQKDEQTKVQLRKSLSECALFRELKPAELNTIVDTMSVETVNKGKRILKQGDAGNALFVIISGVVDCYREDVLYRKEEENGFAVSSSLAMSSYVKRGREFVVSRDAGAIFGELSLMWNTPRSLSVFAQNTCTLGRLERHVYQALVVHRSIKLRNQYERCLRDAKLLETLNDEQIARLVDALKLKTFKKGKAIIKQGDAGQDFFIVLSGECVAKVRTGEDELVHRYYKKGDLFGEVALIKRAPRAASIIATTNVEALQLSRRSFERLLGSLALLHQDSYKTDPRKLIADFFRPGDSRGPLGSLQQLEIETPEPPLSSWFSVFRPTSCDAISKMLNGNAVGKGLNVKGKSAKKNRLSGFVPFVQISSNAHKKCIEKMPDDCFVRIFYRSEAARQDAFEKLVAVQRELVPNGKKVGKIWASRTSAYKPGFSDSRKVIRASTKSQKSRRSMRSNQSHQSKSSAETSSVSDFLLNMFDNTYAPNAFGLTIPGNLLHEAYIMRPDLSPRVEWETGRKSEPAFMDMNMHAVCGDSSPRIVLFQHDEGDPMNPRGLLIAYAERCVKPVVSDFDAFLIASKGTSHDELPEEQAELAAWSLNGAHKILTRPSPDTWHANWLTHLKDETRRGFHPRVPTFGFGDPTSIRLIEDVVAQTSACGAVRHGAECFNYCMPQELDDEYLVVWDEFPGVPWKYMTEPELRKFLIERVHDGFSFPLNPVWPVRDPGWYEVLAALRQSDSAQENLKAWFPAKSNVLQRIDEIHREFPAGFITAETQVDDPLNSTRGTQVSDRSSYGMGLNEFQQLQMKTTTTKSGKFSMLRKKVLPKSVRSSSQWISQKFSQGMQRCATWNASTIYETE